MADFYMRNGERHYLTEEELAEIEAIRAAEEAKEPTEEITDSDRITSLETENKKLSAKLEAAIEANANLEECIVEMAELVYA